MEQSALSPHAPVQRIGEGLLLAERPHPPELDEARRWTPEPTDGTSARSPKPQIASR